MNDFIIGPVLMLEDLALASSNIDVSMEKENAIPIRLLSLENFPDTPFFNQIKNMPDFKTVGAVVTIIYIKQFLC